LKFANATEITPRIPRIEDGGGIWRLIDKCKPLDLNSCYAYLLLCRDFSGTCAVFRPEDEVLAFVSGYVPPGKPDTLFIWQVAVAAELRGLGMAKKLILDILSRDICSGVRFIETTVSPSNQASSALFRSLSSHLAAPLEKQGGFEIDHFPDSGHEAEILFRIGPFNPYPDTRKEAP